MVLSNWKYFREVMGKINFNVGDSVVVKQGVKDPDLEIDIAGWQGRISEIYEEDNLICIEWDSVTLRNMPEEVIRKCEEEDLDWSQMFLEAKEVIAVPVRDTKEEVENTLKELQEKYRWAYLGENGITLEEMLKSAEGHDLTELYEIWENYLTKVLEFPFDVVVTNEEELEYLKLNGPVKATAIVGVDEENGPFIQIVNGKNVYHLPLIDVRPVEHDSPNASHISAFFKWLKEFKNS